MSGNFSSNQKKALAALVSSNSIEAAALACGLTSRTLARYLADPAFAAELARREAVLIDEACRRLVNELQKSVSVLAQIRDDPAVGDFTRLRAANMVIQAMLDLRGLRLEQRLSALEQQVYGSN